jgi:beta-ketoacyl synthase-like protein
VRPCTTGLRAIGDAYRFIQADEADPMIAGGTEAVITPLVMVGCAMRTLSTRNEEPEKASRPWNAQRDGFVMGEEQGKIELERVAARGKSEALLRPRWRGMDLMLRNRYHLRMPSPRPAGPASALLRLLLAGLVTGVVDGSFASVQSFFYDSTPERVFQGVASTLLGPSALDGGARTAAIGVLMHFGVALGWSAVFLLLYESLPRLRSLVQSPLGPLKVASVYGPFIWLVMSLVVIPLLVHHLSPTAFKPRWWVQLIGHIFFVGLPIVSMVGWRDRQQTR